VRAMVLEYPLKDRRAILAAYAGCSASYLDVSGRLFSWEEPDPSTLKLIDEFWAVGNQSCSVHNSGSNPSLARRREAPLAYQS